MGFIETFRTSVTLFFMCLLCETFAGTPQPVIMALVPAGDGVSAGPQGTVQIVSATKSKVRLIGVNFGNSSDVLSKILFTHDKIECTGGRTTKSFPVEVVDDKNGLVEIELDSLEVGNEILYLCLYSSQQQWDHVEPLPWLTVHVLEPTGGPLMPLWLQVSIIAVLLILSGLFSGLNLGLMSLDQTELAIIQKVGSEQEKKHAKRIFPLRQRGNFLLCTLLLGNVMVNSTFTILFDNMTNGLIAILSSTFGIVVFGEIIPQAICSRHGLAVGARTLYITRFFMVVTFPLSYPISLILDKVLGEEMGQVFNKEKLQELIRMTADQMELRDNEANIMAGALQLTNKRVEDVMTKIEDVYMLELYTELDFDTLAEIMRRGYTRVPVYEKEITNIINILNTKELALIDPDDKTQVKTVCRYYDHKPLYVDHDLKLDDMLHDFLSGNSHMAIVQTLHNTENKDPYYENIGVITLEDVIEEILQSEIIDETDRMTDNRLKKPLTQVTDYGLIYPTDRMKSKLPRQLEFVAFQFLSSNVEPFSETYLNRNVLKNLMKKNIVVDLTPTNPVSDKNFLYKKGQPSDKFVLILQGTVEVTIGSESLTFESGPFSYYGTECISCFMRLSVQDLKRVKDYVPDYSVRVLTSVQFLCIQKYQYMAALRTSRMLRSHRQSVDEKKMDDHFDMELAKLVDKNDSHSNLTDSKPHLPLEALKNDEAYKKTSTSSLDKLLSLTRRNDSLTRMNRSGSDARDNSPDQDSIGRRKRTSESSGVEHSDDASTVDKGILPHNATPPVLVSQTSFPFSPHITSESETGNDQESAARIWPKQESYRERQPYSRMDLPAGNNSSEKVPLVEVTPSPQKDGSENPGLAKKFAPSSDKEQKVPLMQHPEEPDSHPKDISL